METEKPVKDFKSKKVTLRDINIKIVVTPL